MENIGNIQIQQDILDAINRLVTLWTQDPVSQTHDLIITRDQFYTINRYDVPYQLSTEELLPPIEDIPLCEDNEISNNVTPLSLPTEESLIAHNDISLFKDTEILAPVTENPTQIDHLEDSEKDCVRQIRNDLLVRSNNTPFRRDLLTTQGWKNQANEIANLLNHEGRGSEREKQVRILETCHYLGRLQQEYVKDAETQDAIRKIIRTVLGPRRTANAWKTAQRIYQLLAYCADSQLYYTQFITSSNLSRLTAEKYNRLLEEVRTHGVRS